MADAAHYKTFNTTLRTLLNSFEKKARSETDVANLDRLKQRIAFIKSQYSEDVICDRAVDVFVIYKEHILARNDVFFLNLNIRAECAAQGIDTSTMEFMYPLIDFMKGFYVSAKPAEKEFLWGSVKILFESSLEYRISKQRK
jgi:hypothetical protein